MSQFYLSICRFFRSKFCRHVVSLLLTIIAIVAFCHCANAYPLAQRTFLDILSFVFVFVGIPITLSVKLWKKRPHKWYALIATIVIISVSACRYYSTAIELETDISKYLGEQSAFNKAASFVMPQKENISGADEISYAHIRSYNLFGFETMEIQLLYGPDTFPAAVKCAEERFAQLVSSAPKDVFYFHEEPEKLTLYGHPYRTYTFTMDGADYAVAYSYCAENNSVYYILIANACLSFMSPADLLDTNDYPGYIFVNQ